VAKTSAFSSAIRASIRAKRSVAFASSARSAAVFSVDWVSATVSVTRRISATSTSCGAYRSRTRTTRS
jgi:hypothetical protein